MKATAREDEVGTRAGGAKQWKATGTGLWLRPKTYLVVDLGGGVLEVDSLLEDIANLLKLDTLRPVVEGSRDVNLLSGVFPVRKSGQ